MAGVFVITGPSGVGKGTLIEELRRRVDGLDLSISATTRAPRPGEQDGRDYHFLSEAEFARRVEAGDFVEHAAYSGRWYGTLKDDLASHGDHSVVLEIEVQGARQVRAAMPEAVGIFIAPPDRETLRRRLRNRGTDDDAEIERRLAVAERELDAQDEFDHVVVNDELDRAAGELEGIVRLHSST